MSRDTFVNRVFSATNYDIQILHRWSSAYCKQTEGVALPNQALTRLLGRIGGSVDYASSPLYDYIEERIFLPGPSFYEKAGITPSQSMAHELAHWTGCPGRLQRFDEAIAHTDHIRADEEVIAELTAAFLNMELQCDHNYELSLHYIRYYKPFG